MNILYISKASFALFFKNLHWFALFLLPLPLLVQYFTPELVSIHLYFYLFVYIMSSFLVVIMGIALVDKIQNDDNHIQSVSKSTLKHFLPVLGFNIIMIMFFILVGIGMAVVAKVPSLSLVGVIIGLVVIIYFSLRWSLSQTLIVAEDLGSVEAMNRSTELMQGYKWPFVGLLLIVVLTISLWVLIHYLYVGAANYAMYQMTLIFSPDAYRVFLIISTLGMQLTIIHIYLFYQRRMALLDEQPDVKDDEVTSQVTL